MLSFEEVGRLLDSAAEALPREIFLDLNGGVNLIDEERRDEDGNYIMGLYHHNGMGRYIEIFYGSFAALYPRLPAEKLEAELRKTLHHELTHHIENKAGDRTLERWDERHKAELAMGPPLRADSILFVCGDGAVLSPVCRALFERECARRGMNVNSACAGLEAPPQPPVPEALKAASDAGADLSSASPVQVTRRLLEDFDAALCMTMGQAQELAERFPEQEEKIMCLGRRDINPPRLKSGWARLMRALSSEIDALCDELEEE